MTRKAIDWYHPDPPEKRPITKAEHRVDARKLHHKLRPDDWRNTPVVWMLYRILRHYRGLTTTARQMVLAIRATNVELPPKHQNVFVRRWMLRLGCKRIDFNIYLVPDHGEFSFVPRKPVSLWNKKVKPPMSWEERSRKGGIARHKQWIRQKASAERQAERLKRLATIRIEKRRVELEKSRRQVQ